MTIRSTAAKLAAAGVATALMAGVASPSLADGFGRDAYARDYGDAYVEPNYRYDTRDYAAPNPVTGFVGAVGGVVGTVGSAVGSTVNRVFNPYHGGYHDSYAYAPRGYSDYAYAPRRGYSAYASQGAPGGPLSGGAHYQFELTKDMAGHPIYANQLRPGCNLGDQLNEDC